MNAESENSSIARLRRLVPEIERRGVARVWAFGSRAAGRARADSDWDVLVEFKPDEPPTFDRFMGLKLFLEEELGAKVDLLSWTACKERFLAAIQDELVPLHAS